MSKPRFLVVGERDINILKEQLSSLGYNDVETVTHNTENITQTLNNNDYQIIIADLGANNEGLELIERLKQSNNQIPVLLVITEDKEEEMLLADVISYVTKPVSLCDLERAIRGMLK